MDAAQAILGLVVTHPYRAAGIFEDALLRPDLAKRIFGRQPQLGERHHFGVDDEPFLFLLPLLGAEETEQIARLQRHRAERIETALFTVQPVATPQTFVPVQREERAQRAQVGAR